MFAPPQDPDHLPIVKVVLLGDHGVGKSWLKANFFSESVEDVKPTRRVDYGIRTLVTNGCGAKLQVWDTAGHSADSMITSFYFGAKGFVLCYDVCSERSFASMRHWISRLEEYNDAVKVLVGNKCDENKSQWQVSCNRGQALADEYDILFFETSGKSGLNVEQVFTAITKKIVAKLPIRDWAI